MVVLASPKHREVPSVLQGMPSGPFASNADWTVRLEGDEEVTAVAVGGTWCACATTALYLRVYTPTGAPLAVLAVPGPVVALAGAGSHLAVVYHRGGALPGTCTGMARACALSAAAALVD